MPMYSAHPESNVLQATSSIVHASGQAGFDRFLSCEEYLIVMAKTRIAKPLRIYVSASDIVQETYASAFRRMAEPDRPEIRNPKNWLTGILLNKVRAAWRTYAAELFGPTLLIPIGEPGTNGSMAGTCDDPEKDLDGRDTFAWAMAELPEGQRCVIELYLRHSMEMPEVARTLGITESCARQRYRRGMQLLKDRIDPDDHC